MPAQVEREAILLKTELQGLAEVVAAAVAVTKVYIGKDYTAVKSTDQDMITVEQVVASDSTDKEPTGLQDVFSMVFLEILDLGHLILNILPPREVATEVFSMTRTPMELVVLLTV